MRKFIPIGVEIETCGSPSFELPLESLILKVYSSYFLLLVQSNWAIVQYVVALHLRLGKRNPQLFKFLRKWENTYGP